MLGNTLRSFPVFNSTIGKRKRGESGRERERRKERNSPFLLSIIQRRCENWLIASLEDWEASGSPMWGISKNCMHQAWPISPWDSTVPGMLRGSYYSVLQQVSLVNFLSSIFLNRGKEAKGHISFSDKHVYSFNPFTNVCQKTLLVSGNAKPNEAGLWPQGAYGLTGEEDKPVKWNCAEGKTGCYKSPLRPYLNCTGVFRTGHALSWTVKTHRN